MSESYGGPSAGDYEQIVVILRRYPNHFPDLAFGQVRAGNPMARGIESGLGFHKTPTHRTGPYLSEGISQIG